MKYFEKFSTGFLHSTDELRKLIIENPDLPLLIFTESEDRCIYDSYRYTCCSDMHVHIGEFLDCCQNINEEICYSDRNEFENDVRLFYEDLEETQKMTDEEFDVFLKNKIAEYEPFWKKCIVVWVGN